MSSDSGRSWPLPTHLGSQPAGHSATQDHGAACMRAAPPGTPLALPRRTHRTPSPAVPCVGRCACLQAAAPTARVLRCAGPARTSSLPYPYPMRRPSAHLQPTLTLPYAQPLHATPAYPNPTLCAGPARTSSWAARLSRKASAGSNVAPPPPGAAGSAAAPPPGRQTTRQPSPSTYLWNSMRASRAPAGARAQALAWRPHCGTGDGGARLRTRQRV